MFRPFLILLLFGTLLLLADDADGVWKATVMRALYFAGQKDYGKSEQVFLEALHAAQQFGADDARLGTTLNSLGLVYRAEKKYPEAEGSYRKALAILEKSYGTNSIDVANVNFNIATVMFDQGHQVASLPALQKTLQVYETMLGANSLKTGGVLCMLGDYYRLTKDLNSAEGLLKRCADIRETGGGMQNPELADALHSLALVYTAQGKYALAEPRFTLAEKIREKTLGITSPALAQTMEDHAALLRQMGRDKDAARLDAMASAIRHGQK